ncbi:hypothetical protein [Streptomyces daghestanicus]|uniref:Uncharacterized protein n=1 Tax=Streptomyces daghestanicus TaxID=66885 RepID=A0ABQ3Q0P3_9ACTN|nr:hypothetical protein [Streptomyces daghestanicus]GGU39527.1 hypothetical protein GCM10010259_32800 [Streptomyces daghestanicus]GHI30839.1 hypothetical protein Sdagh_25690 [Streptomyces daghestanicus]
MATATIENVFCVRPSSGTDIEVLNRLAELAAALVPDVFQLDESIKSPPAVAAVIDTAGEWPDDLYMTKTPYDGLDNSFWPRPLVEGEASTEVEAGASAPVNVMIDVAFPQNISLGDEDTSGHEHLGSCQIEEGDLGAGKPRQARQERLTRIRVLRHVPRGMRSTPAGTGWRLVHHLGLRP